MAQVEYRLAESAGCDRHRAHGQAAEVDGQDRQVDYRMEQEGRGLTWIGNGLREFGITPGSRMTGEQKDAARAIMDGCDPRTGEQLVGRVPRVDPRAKLVAAPLAEALEKAAAERGTTAAAMLGVDKQFKQRVGALLRGVARAGEGHLIPVGVAEKLAAAADEATCTRDASCRCPVPRQILDHVGTKIRIVHTCADQLNPPDTHAPDWPIASIYSWQILGFLALPHELHPD